MADWHDNHESTVVPATCCDGILRSEPAIGSPEFRERLPEALPRPEELETCWPPGSVAASADG